MTNAIRFHRAFECAASANTSACGSAPSALRPNSLREFASGGTGTRSGIQFDSAEEVSEYLIQKALVSTVSWDDVGPFLRFSVTFAADGYEKEKEVIGELERRLLDLGLVF